MLKLPLTCRGKWTSWAGQQQTRYTSNWNIWIVLRPVREQQQLTYHKTRKWELTLYGFSQFDVSEMRIEMADTTNTGVPILGTTPTNQTIQPAQPTTTEAHSTTAPSSSTTSDTGERHTVWQSSCSTYHTNTNSTSSSISASKWLINRISYESKMDRKWKVNRSYRMSVIWFCPKKKIRKHTYVSRKDKKKLKWLSVRKIRFRLQLTRLVIK